MNQAIHPTYHTDAKVVCACGHTFATGSTMKEIRVEICSNCHPFYSGKQKLIDTAGRVDRFKKQSEKSAQIKATAKPKKERVKKFKVDETIKIGEKAKAEA